MATPWRIRQFGAVTLTGPGFESGRPATFETQRAAKILTLLALVRNGQMRREDLADALWPDDYYDATRLRLRKELSRLRQSLGPAADALVGEAETIGLDRSRFETDVEILRRANATAQDDPRRRARLCEAAEASAGPFLPGWEDPWAVAERHAAEGLKGRILVALGETLLAEGDAEGALAAVRPAIDHDPCHEPARLVAIHAHAALGSLTAAVAEFQQMKRLMRELKDAAPSFDAETVLSRMREGERVAVAPSPARGLPPLAAPLDSFFGREKEMATLLARLAPAGPTRLLSLVGTGGIGKSRLAWEAARALCDAYASNVAFVSLAESPSPDLAAATLLAHLGWQGAAAADPVLVVASTLPPGPCLLVLDNLEHLLPAVAGLVRRLLEAVPALRVLATSRQSLHLAGEHIVTVGPLGDAAGAMLADLARSVRPEVADDPDLAELARRLDGIPLALRLAAPRLRVLGPRALLDRLGDRFRLLQSDAPDLPERHRSLRAALDGSFEALGERERRALVEAAPFRGGWTLAHLERILPDDDGLALMEALVDASLVSVDDRGPTVRFGMMETVREYVTAREGSSEARRAFAKAIGEELNERLPSTLTPRSLALLGALDAEADNLHLAVEAAIDTDPDAARLILGRLWIYDTIRGRQAELEGIYRSFAAAHPDVPLGPASEFGRGMALLGLNRNEEAAESFRKVVRACLDAGLEADAALVEALGLIAVRRLGTVGFDTMFERLRALAPQIERDSAAEGRFLLIEGELLFYARRLPEALDRLQRAYVIAKRIGDAVGEIYAVHRRSFTALDMGAHGEVYRALVEIGPSVERLGDPAQRGAQEELFGRTALRTGAYAEALAHFQRSREEWARLGDVYQLADQDNSIARALLGLGRSDEVRRSARAAFGEWRAVGDFGGMAVALHTLTAALLVSDPPRAAQAMRAARELAADHGLEFVQNENEFMADLKSRLGDEGSLVEDAEALFDVEA